MLAWLDGKLRENGLAQEAIRKQDTDSARVLFRLAAEVCVGIREVGTNTGPMVKLLQDTINGPDPHAWCMSFVQTCLAYVENKTGHRSPVYPSELCMEVWERTFIVQRVKNIPLAGAIAIWRHGQSRKGHTGIVESADGSLFHAIEGNTTYSALEGTVVRDGGGVARTTRKFNPSGTMRLVGFLKPF